MQSKQPDDPGVDPTVVKDGVIQSWREFFYAALVLAIFMTFVAMTFPAKAQHQQHNAADSNHWYDVACCALNDCAPVPASMVRETPAGFEVTIRPGTHPMWGADKTENLVVVFSYQTKKVRPSQDGNWHVCINYSGDPLCLYVTGGGF